MSGGRYAGTPTSTVETPDGTGGVRTVRFITRRRIPPAAAGPVVALHPVARGDRLDSIAARYYADPLSSWQVADANEALDPFALTAPESEGDLLIIPVPVIGA